MSRPRTHGGIPVARASRPVSESALREYLLAEALDFRHLMVGTLLDDPEWAKLAWFETSKAVDRLASGGEHSFHRWQLPDGHPMRDVGSIHDDLVLGVDGVLRVVS